MAEKYLSDNAGNRVASHVGVTDSIAESGQRRTTGGGGGGTEQTLTVVPGALYRVTGNDISASGNPPPTILLSITGVTSTAANIEWVCPSGKALLIKIPAGVTTLYLSGTTGGLRMQVSRIS